MEPFHTKSCWPVFDEDNELDEVIIRYVYLTDEFDPKTKDRLYRWAQYKLGKYKDVMYDNPVFDRTADKIPAFKERKILTHNLGFVQGEWFKNGMDFHDDDGHSYLKGSLKYLDDLNYLSSKESSALYYALYPTLVGFGVSNEPNTPCLLYTSPSPRD